MSLAEAKTKYDGFSMLNRGVDSGTDPSIIGKDQVSFAINTTFRRDYTENRPGWAKLDLTGAYFQLGRFQGAHAYIDDSGVPSIIASIGGSIVRFNVMNNVVTNLSTSSGLSNTTKPPLVWMVQAERYLLIQDGVSIPMIWDGSSLIRATPVAFGGVNLPVGCMMEYNNGRLWVALEDRKSFVAGDLAYSITGDAKDVLSFTENSFIDGGGSFGMPSSAGRINAMKSVAIQDSTLGQGPLQVFGQGGSASMNAPFDRTTWQQLNSPIQSVSLIAPGPVGQYAVTTVNGDLWYRSLDGIRSFMVARRDHGTWVNTPLSFEMDRVLARDDPNLLQNASCVVFDNRLLCTVSPYRATTNGTEYGVAWRGLAALDFSPVSLMFDRSQPVWEGIWTGLQILQIVQLTAYGNERCFIFALNSSNVIELWELSKSASFDEISTPIEWAVETRAHGFDDEGQLLKQLTRTEHWLQAVQGTVSFNFSYRPDSFWGWLPLDSGSVCATTGLCTGPACGPLILPQLQYRPRILSASPDTSCEPCVDKQYRSGYQFQFKLEMTGAAQLKRFRVAAVSLPENTNGGCFPETSCCLETGCESDIWSYTSS